MKIDIQLTRDSDDLANDHFVNTIYSLTGIKELPDTDEGKPHPYRRAFNKLRGRSASITDYEIIHRAVTELTEETKANARTMEVFTEKRLNQIWAEGVIQTADLAMRNWISFLECTLEDLNTECETLSILRNACCESLSNMIASASSS